MPTAEKIQEWKQRIDESKGALTLLPESLKKAAQAVEDLRTAFNEKAKAMSKEEIELRVQQENMLLEIRRELEKTDKDIWLKNIAILPQALEDGVYVVHTVMPQARGQM